MAIAVRTGERQEDANEPVKVLAFVDDPETEATTEDSPARMNAPRYRVHTGGVRAAIEYFSTHGNNCIMKVDIV